MTLAVGILILVAAVAVAVGAILLVRRRAPEGSYFSDGDRASGVFGVLATGFSIFAGFVLFLAFTSYDQSRSGAETEALVLVQQYETAQFLPATARARLRGELECYGRYVVQQEWPRMEDGTAGDAISPWALALFRTLETVQPETSAEEAAYGKWLDQTSDREAARQDRLHGAAGIIPTSIWIVLFLTAAVVFTFMLFFADSAELSEVAGDAHRLGDRRRHHHAPRNSRARPPLPRSRSARAGGDGTVSRHPRRGTTGVGRHGRAAV